MIDKTKSFEGQIETLKKIDDLSQYWDMNHYNVIKRQTLKFLK